VIDMAVLKYWDATAGEYRTILAAAKGEKGDTGPQGPPGQDGVAGSLNQLSDVTVAPDTPVGKFLGTTGVGAWGEVDALTPAEGDARYLLVDPLPGQEQTLLGGLTMTGGIVANWGEFTLGASMNDHQISAVADPTAPQDVATKAYVDARTSAVVNGWARKVTANQQVIPSGLEQFITIHSAASLNNVALGPTYLTTQIAGYWMVGLNIYCPQGPWVWGGGRAFCGIVGATSDAYYRQSIGPGEDSQGMTTLIHSKVGERISFKIYHEFGSSRTLSAAVTMKYLGPADD